MDLAAIVGALGAVLLVLSRSRAPLLAGFVLLGAGAAGLVLAFRPGAGLEAIPGSPLALAAIAAGGLLLAGLAALVVRFPALVIPLLLFTAPLRPPLDPDPDAALFVSLQPPGMVGYHFPFYVVLAASVLALMWRASRGHEIRALPLGLAVPAAALIALTAVSLVWSRDTSQGITQLMLFWFPFTALIAVAARSPFPAWMPRVLAAILIGLACVFAAVGIVETLIQEVIFYTEGLARANEKSRLFRVTSVFQDPSIYARHLVVAMGVVLVAAWLRRLRLTVAVAISVLLAAGVYVSYSQSAMLALIVVAMATAFAAGDRSARRAIVVVTITLVVVGAGVLAAAIATGRAESFTRNRSGLVTDTALVFRNHPLIGVGVGGQAVATREEAGASTALGRNESHTTPLTVAAELGILGLAAYVALLVGAVRLLAALTRRDAALGLGMAAVLLVLFIHALAYEGFFEEPTTWGVLGAAVAALGARAAAEPTAEDHAMGPAATGSAAERERSAPAGPRAWPPWRR